jgi:hypothetical protein
VTRVERNGDLVLICGSRSYPEELRAWVREAISELSIGSIVMSGAASRGPDAWAIEDAHDLGYTVLAVPADWDTHVDGCGCAERVGPRGGKRYCRTAGFRRNQKMIDMRPNFVLAFWDGQSSGTHHTIKSAVRAGIPVRVFAPPKKSMRLSLWDENEREYEIKMVDA